MLKKSMIGLLSATIILSGCANFQPQAQGGTRALENQNQPVRVLNNPAAPEERGNTSLSLIVEGENTGALPIVRQADQTYVPIENLFQTLGYNVSRANQGEIQIGYTDPIFTITEDSTQATVDERQVDLPHTVTTIENKTYATVASLQALLGDAYQVQQTADSLVVTPVGNSLFPEEDHGWENFKEEDTEATPTVSSAEANRIISMGRKYLGRPYEFGARTGQTRTFDCSSYVQYLYGKQGIRLPRTARAQATRGNRIAVANLKPGDLLYFSVPGRFRSDKTVGHVGIYMGNGRMIHAVPPKVQITNVANSSYWKRVYLGARRVG
ncbi:C40 family peptidase [Ammoniphilus sp. YIM 78166]|uniref:C40 family peptidase n=1 Tax=Ammoniphilus sp. YIM 78166 TaxID=1644106 RepID=UPI0014316815|nr:C40 family peptidase [Ammoniphilus sp. YIM 78166]